MYSTNLKNINLPRRGILSQSKKADDKPRKFCFIESFTLSFCCYSNKTFAVMRHDI